MRKDIEILFGVLQARFKILCQDDHRWFMGDIIDSSFACVILHNLMIRMNEAGCLTEDFAEERGQMDII